MNPFRVHGFLGNSGKQNRSFQTHVPNHPEIIPFRIFSVIFRCFTHTTDIKPFTFSLSQYVSLTKITRNVLLLPLFRLKTFARLISWHGCIILRTNLMRAGLAVGSPTVYYMPVISDVHLRYLRVPNQTTIWTR